jgi:hypothetical protein
MFDPGELSVDPLVLIQRVGANQIEVAYHLHPFPFFPLLAPSPPAKCETAFLQLRPLKVARGRPVSSAAIVTQRADTFRLDRSPHLQLDNRRELAPRRGRGPRLLFIGRPAAPG